MSNQFKVLTNLQHDNVEYPVGSTIELNDNGLAQGLINDGVIESADKKEPTPAPVASTRLDKTKKDKEEKKDGEDNANGDDKDKKDGEGEDDGLEALTVPKLLKLAETEEITLEAGLKKPEIVEAIRAARAEKKDGGDDL